MESKAHQSALVAWCVAIAKMMLITMQISATRFPMPKVISFPLPKSEPYRNEGRESKCLEASLVGSVLRKHHRAVRLVCQLPLGLRSFVGVLRSWTLASDLPGAVADCCQVSSANPGKSFEQIGGSELGGNFMVLHGRQLAAMRGCKGGRFAATRRYFVSLFVEPWRLPVTNG